MRALRGERVSSIAARTGQTPLRLYPLGYAGRMTTSDQYQIAICRDTTGKLWRWSCRHQHCDETWHPVDDEIAARKAADKHTESHPGEDMTPVYAGHCPDLPPGT